jgi:hypothetical protein
MEKAMAKAKTKASKSRDPYAYRRKLPFMGRTRHASTWWDVSPTGNWNADFETGKKYAMTFWRVAGSRSSFGLDFGEIMFGMMVAETQRRHSGIEVGFIRTLGDLMGWLFQLPVVVGRGFDEKKKSFRRLPRPVLRKGVWAATRFIGLIADSHHKKEAAKMAEFKKQHGAVALH